MLAYLPRDAASPVVIKRRKKMAKMMGAIMDKTIPTAIRV
jgi:hypothetical protein